MRWLCFRCPCCGDSPESRAFPFCRACLNGLRFAPRTCSDCGSLLCPEGSCLRPWAALPGLRFLGASRLLTGPGYSVLKSWKKSLGPATSRRVFHELKLPGGDWDLIVPVPQRFVRSWRLGGCPSELIAHELSRSSGKPMLRALLAPGRGRPQASLSLTERTSRKLDFRVRPDLAPRLRGHRLLLVDDFLTSGRTVRLAAQALLGAGARQVSVYCLGIRPRLDPRLRQAPGTGIPGRDCPESAPPTEEARSRAPQPPA
jgi:predicted amidophosphoribosyltransferase